MRQFAMLQEEKQQLEAQSQERNGVTISIKNKYEYSILTVRSLM
jgi:hypothetical protein